MHSGHCSTDRPLAGPLKAAAKELRGQGERSRASSAGDASGPVESFVALERAAAVALVEAVNRTLAGIGRVLRGQDTISPSVQVRTRPPRRAPHAHDDDSPGFPLASPTSCS